MVEPRGDRPLFPLVVPLTDHEVADVTALEHQMWVFSMYADGDVSVDDVLICCRARRRLVELRSDRKEIA